MQLTVPFMSMILVSMGPSIPSMKPYFLNPLLKETSPYWVDVCKSFHDFIDQSDKELLDKYLKSVCLVLAVILKR